MSGKLQIHFGMDMPAAAVEVVAPDLESVGRVWLEPGGSAGIEVPSEESFLRVHLPSGQVVTLHDPGNLDRQIRLHDLTVRSERQMRSRSAPSREYKQMADLRAVQQYRSLARGVVDVDRSMNPGPPLHGLVDGSRVEIQLHDGS